VAAIAASIKEWGWTSPALVGEDGGLIAGHARVLAARQLGIPLCTRPSDASRGGNQRPWPADKVERWAIERLIPYAKNARTHTDAQVAAIAASIKEWGWTSPALVGEDGGLIAGHARVLAARQLGIAEIPVMVAVGWTEAQKRAYVLADNQLAITGSGWDPELLRLELGELANTSPPSSRARARARVEADQSYMLQPATGAALYTFELPTEGGETFWVDLRAAYAGCHGSCGRGSPGSAVFSITPSGSRGTGASRISIFRRRRNACVAGAP
jgi:hypothetical protein